MDEADDVSSWRAQPPTVAAVLVSHRGARWLPQSLASIDALECAPSALVAVHDGTDQQTEEMLNAALGADRVVTSSRGLGFGDHVRFGLQNLPRTDWIWLLHDDAIVDPSALSGLLDVATTADDIAVVGPKVREWPSLRRLLEVGVTVTGTGARETGLESGEPDAGQFDRPRDVLAVGTAGMLVRRTVWDDLGGLDPALPLFFDDIDFGWRVARAGWRVRTAPGAVIFHAEASRGGRRDREAGVAARRGERRGAALLTMLANETRARLPFQFVRLFLGSVLRAIAFLVGKDLRSARSELSAVASVYGRPWRIISARRRRSSLVRVRRRQIAHLFAPPWLPYQHGLDLAATTAEAVIRPEVVTAAGLRTAGRGPGLVVEDEVIEEQPVWWRRRPWLVTVTVMVALAVVAGRGLLSGGLHSPVLPATPESVSSWWSLLLSRNHAIGLGSTDWAPAYVVPLALVGSVVWFSPALVTSVVLLFSVPLAALTAHRFGRSISDDRVARMIWATGYGLLTVASGAVAQGRIGTVVALIVAPVIAGLALRVVTAPTWPTVMHLAWWIAVAGAFAPVSFLIVLVVLAAVALAVRTAAVRIVVSVVVAAALLGPWLLTRVFSGADVWWEAGRAVSAPVDPWQVALGLGGGSANAPAWAALAVVVLAVAALVPAATRRPVLVAWGVALVALTTGLVASRTALSVGGQIETVRAWAGLGGALWLGALGVAVLLAAPSARALGPTIARPLVALLLVFPVVVGAWWVLRGVEGPLDDGNPSVVPAYLAAEDGTTAILTGQVSTGLAVEVVSGGGPLLGQETARPTEQRRDDLVTAIRGLTAQPTRSDVDTLARVSVSSIYAPDVDPDLAHRLDAASGLGQAGSDDPSSRVWTVNSSESVEPGPVASSSRPWLAGAWVLMWVVVALAAVPSRPGERER